MVKRFEEESSYSERSPQFFKIFLPDHCSKKLRIPPAFLKYLKQGCPSKCIITSHVRDSWTVDLNKVDDNLYFQSGWEEFVQDNSLEFGDFLVFCYDGQSNFYVSVYGKSRCRKEVCDAGKQCDSERGIHPQRNHANEPGKTEDVVYIDDTEEVDTRHPTVSRTIRSKNPNFEITLGPAYMSKGLLSIPQKFTRVMKVRRGYVKLLNSSKAWVVKLVGDFTSRLQLSKGWQEFVRENGLCLGDVCSFELIGVEKDMFVMNVSILRTGKKSSVKTVEFFLTCKELFLRLVRSV